MQKSYSKTDENIKDKSEKIIVGVCCMKKKLKSKPMQAILTILKDKFSDELSILEFE